MKCLAKSAMYLWSEEMLAKNRKRSTCASLKKIFKIELVFTSTLFNLDRLS